MLNKVEAVVRGNILPFWQSMADTENGGFYGEADFFGMVDKTAAKGGILHARILWTFSAAYRLFKDESYKTCAAHVKEFLTDAFLDKDYGGLYWLVDHKGQALDKRSFIILLLAFTRSVSIFLLLEIERRWIWRMLYLMRLRLTGLILRQAGI